MQGNISSVVKQSFQSVFSFLIFSEADEVSTSGVTCDSKEKPKAISYTET